MIETYYEYYSIDNKSLVNLAENQDQEIISLVSSILNVPTVSISNLEILKRGMTNKSFTFFYNNEKYIIRIPGEGTDKLINRNKEMQVYNMVSNYGISDDLIYINSKNGYKITKYLSLYRPCNPKDLEDVEACMSALKKFHNLRLYVPYEFDLFSKIEFYESLRNGKDSMFKDYYKTKKNVYRLKQFVDSQDKNYVLTHIDAIPDNFLLLNNDVKIIDWEYSAMQDSHVDIAMFAIYSSYNKKEIDTLIDIYFTGKCDKKTRLKIYCYIAICGLLWSNWCEYKLNLGVKFGDYMINQYKYAKEYYEIVKKEIGIIE